MKLITKNKSQIDIPDKVAAGIANGILKSQRWFDTRVQGLTKAGNKNSNGFFFI